MKLIYDKFGRLDEIKFAKGENQEAFWKSFEAAQKEITKRYEISQKEATRQCEIIHKHYADQIATYSLQRFQNFENMQVPPPPISQTVQPFVQNQ